MSQYHDLNTILTALRTRMIQKKTGTFFIATDDNASARFSLDKGRLTHCVFKRQNGQDAVRVFCAITGGRYSFSDAPFPFRENSRIDHEQALQTLGILLPQKLLHPKQSKTLNAEKEQTETPPLKKQVRYYRGQRIED